MHGSIIYNVKGYPSRVPFHPDRVYPEFSNNPHLEISDSPNLVYDSVRRLFLENYPPKDDEDLTYWNPLRILVPEGGVVTIKPNMVRHWNEKEDSDIFSVITHWSIVRVVIDYALLAVGPNGKVYVGDAPHWDCDFSKLETILNIEEFRKFYDSYASGQVHFVDFRPEWFEASGVVNTKKGLKLQGDPNGYYLVDLGKDSMFNDSSLDAKLFYGSGYDNKDTIHAHSEGRHQYLSAGTPIVCDLFINIPKLKTHHLLGLTVAMKNLVGINGNKNYLPHFRLGFKEEGGDQYPKKTPSLLLRYYVLRYLLPLLAKSYLLMKFWGILLGLVHKSGGKNPYAGGAWHGNDTVWRMTLDLNRCLLFTDKKGNLNPMTSRKYINIVDGVISGEGEGPMCVSEKYTNLLIHTHKPLVADAIAAQLMGYDLRHMKLLVEGVKKHRFDLLPDIDDLSSIPIRILKAQDPEVKTKNTLLIKELESLSFKKPEGWKNEK